MDIINRLTGLVSGVNKVRYIWQPCSLRVARPHLVDWPLWLVACFARPRLVGLWMLSLCKMRTVSSTARPSMCDLENFVYAEAGCGVLHPLLAHAVWGRPSAGVSIK